MILGYIVGLYRDNWKENANDHIIPHESKLPVKP